MKAVESRQNPAVRRLQRLLRQGRARRDAGVSLIEGEHLLDECLSRLERGDGCVHLAQTIWSQSAWERASTSHLIARCSAWPVLLLPDGVFRELSGLDSPPGVMAEIQLPEPQPVPDAAGSILVLDAIQDPGNLGSILRTAAAAGISWVVCGAGCADVWSPKVLRAGQGAHFRLGLLEEAQIGAWLDGRSEAAIATVATGGDSVFSIALPEPLIWMFGSEGQGLAPELLARASRRVTIPLAAGAESLNVAAAVAVCLFEARRRSSVR